MKAIILDDDVGNAKDIAEALLDNGIKPYVISHSSYEESAEEVCSRLRCVHSELDVYDALVLDINYVDDILGGTRIYTEILRQGLRKKFRHLIVATQFAVQQNSQYWRAVLMFSELVFIDQDSILPKSPSKNIAQRIINLKTQKNPPIGSFGIWHFPKV